jgi:hypothetical protein
MIHDCCDLSVCNDVTLQQNLVGFLSSKMRTRLADLVNPLHDDIFIGLRCCELVITDIVIAVVFL